MKKERTFLVVLLFAACQTFAQQQTHEPLASQAVTASALNTNRTASVTFTAPKSKLRLFGPAKPVPTQQAVRIDGLDPRAWTTVAETRTSNAAFPNGHTHRAGLCLFWWGAETQSQK